METKYKTQTKEIDAGDESKMITTIKVNNTGNKYFYVDTGNGLILIDNREHETSITCYHIPRNKLNICASNKTTFKINTF